MSKLKIFVFYALVATAISQHQYYHQRSWPNIAVDNGRINDRFAGYLGSDGKPSKSGYQWYGISGNSNGAGQGDTQANMNLDSLNGRNGIGATSGTLGGVAGLVNGVGKGVGGTLSGAGSLVDGIGSGIGGIKDSAGSFVNGVGNAAGGLRGSAGILANGAGGAHSAFGGLANGYGNGGLGNGIGSGIGGFGGGAHSGTGGLTNGIGNEIVGTFGGFNTVSNGIANGAGGAVGVGGGPANSIGNGFGGTVGGGAINSGGTAGVSGLPSINVGNAVSLTVNGVRFIQVGSKYYWIDTSKAMNWHAAHSTCRRNNAQLATIKSEQEMKAIDSFLSAFRKDKKNFWIAGNDLAEENKFEWVSNGQPMTYAKWSPGQPDNYKGIEDCVGIWVQKNQYMMNDFNCDSKLNVLCEADTSCMYARK